MMQRTLLNIKPDAVKKNLTGEILKRVESQNFRIVAMKKIYLRKHEVESFYAVHKGKPFYEPLVKFMISGPCVAVVVEGENVIQGIRNIAGATDPEEAEDGTIRKDYAENVRVNCVHSSDSFESAAREIPFFFSQIELLQEQL